MHARETQLDGSYFRPKKGRWHPQSGMHEALPTLIVEPRGRMSLAKQTELLDVCMLAT